MELVGPVVWQPCGSGLWTEKLLGRQSLFKADTQNEVRLAAHPKEAAMSKESNKGSESCSIRMCTQRLVDVE